MVITASFSFHLPPGSQLKVKEGDLVNADDLIAKIPCPPVIKEYPLATTLEVSPNKVLDCLLKKLGEEIKEGEVLAESKTLLGKSKANFVSPFNGSLDSLTEDGILRIRLPREEVEVRAPFAGQIALVGPKQVDLAFPGQELKASRGAGAPKIGTIFCLEKQQADVFDLDGDFQGKIVVVQDGFNQGFWHKAVSLGLSGLITAELTDSDLKRIVEQELAEKESSVLPVLFFEDFMPQIWQIFQKNEGKIAIIEGSKKRVLFPKEK